MLMGWGPPGGDGRAKAPEDQFSMCAHVAALICLNVTNGVRNAALMEWAETGRPSRRTINVMNFGMGLIVLKGSPW